MDITQKTKEKYLINENNPVENKRKRKHQIENKCKEYFKQKMESDGKNKSKVNYLLEAKPNWQPGNREKYLTHLTRNQASNIF